MSSETSIPLPPPLPSAENKSDAGIPGLLPGQLPPYDGLFPKASGTFIPAQLHFAINRNDLDRVKELVRSNIDLNYYIYGNNPLLLAIINEHYAIAQVLIDAGACIHSAEKNEWQRQAIHLACKQGHLHLVQKLLECGASVNAVDATMLTPLHWASIQGHVDIVHFMVAEGADLNALDDTDRSPVFRATENGQLRVVEYLCKCGAELNIQDKWGCSALYYAIVRGEVEMVKTLLQYGADPNLRDNVGETTLHVACDQIGGRHVAIICCSDINITNRNVMRPPSYLLNVLTQNKFVTSIKVVQLLIDNGADCSLQNLQGESPLQKAATGGNVIAVMLLVKAGCNLWQERWLTEGKMPTQLAQLQDYCDWLVEAARQGVKPLQNLCCQNIRKVIGRDINLKVKLLPLPGKLKSDLVVDIDWETMQI